MKTAMTTRIITGGRTFLCALLLAGMLPGCLKNYGRVQPDANVTSMFIEGRVPADYQYYFNGRNTMPYAIIGIKPDYQFVAKFWTSITPNTDTFKKMARDAWTTPAYETPAAGYLLSPDGTQIGLWYSSYPWATIKMKGDNALAVYSPYQPDSGAFMSD